MRVAVGRRPAFVKAFLRVEFGKISLFLFKCQFILQGCGLALLFQQVSQHEAGLGCVQGSPVHRQRPGIHDPLCLRRPHTAECAGWEERGAVAAGGGGWHRLVSDGTSGDRRLLLPRQLQLPLAAGAGEDAAGGRSQGGGGESCGGSAGRSSSHHQRFLYWSVLLLRAVGTVECQNCFVTGSVVCAL